jgi:hypothetical protein
MPEGTLKAPGSYKEGIMLFLGLGTGLGSSLVVEGKVVPMELAHLSYWKGTCEDYIGIRGFRLWDKNGNRHRSSRKKTLVYKEYDHGKEYIYGSKQ